MASTFDKAYFTLGFERIAAAVGMGWQASCICARSNSSPTYHMGMDFGAELLWRSVSGEAAGLSLCPGRSWRGVFAGCPRKALNMPNTMRNEVKNNTMPAIDQNHHLRCRDPYLAEHCPPWPNGPAKRGMEGITPMQLQLTKNRLFSILGGWPYLDTWSKPRAMVNRHPEPLPCELRLAQF